MFQCSNTVLIVLSLASLGRPLTLAARDAVFVDRIPPPHLLYFDGSLHAGALTDHSVHEAAVLHSAAQTCSFLLPTYQTADLDTISAALSVPSDTPRMHESARGLMSHLLRRPHTVRFWLFCFLSSRSCSFITTAAGARFPCGCDLQLRVRPFSRNKCSVVNVLPGRV
ncbi:hypothetical protein BV20DRAFT_554129 [Pilatotrama ljubarskyi]|nr:hypothetical protein BV20DRAFT_554129 [Pilatotrama ljubarskyi]